MPPSDRARELIQKSLEAIASDSELAELDRLLATEPEVADALADAARLHASLTRHFGKQQKLDQVARLLDQGHTESGLPAQSAAGGHDSDNLASGDTSDFDISAIDLCQFDPGHIDPAMAAAGPSISSYVARDSKTIRLFDLGKRRRSRLANPGWKWATLTLVLLVSVLLWSWWGSNSRIDRYRVVVGRVAVAAQEVAEVPVNVAFEVVGGSSAILELPGGARLELTSSSRGTLHQEDQRNGRQVVLTLEAGGGVINVLRDSVSCRVRTSIADITTTAGKVSFNLVAAESSHSVGTISMQLPRLIVSVAEGSAIVEQAGTSTILTVGEGRTLSSISRGTGVFVTG